MGTACDCRTHKRSILGPGSEIETSLGNEIVLISVALKVFSSILYSKTYQKKNALHQSVLSGFFDHNVSRSKQWMSSFFVIGSTQKKDIISNYYFQLTVVIVLK